MTYPDELWQLTKGPGAPMREREAELVPAAAREIQDELLRCHRLGRPIDAMFLAQEAFRAMAHIMEPHDETDDAPRKCGQDVEGCKGGPFCPHLSDGTRTALANFVWEHEEEKAIRAANPGNSVTREPMWKIQTKHNKTLPDGSIEIHPVPIEEDMWIGGSRTWYSAWHGRRDH